MNMEYVRAAESRCLVMVDRALWHNPHEVGRGLDVFRERTLVGEGPAVHKPGDVVSNLEGCNVLAHLHDVSREIAAEDRAGNTDGIDI